MKAALAPAIWTTGTTEVFKTGTWRASMPRHVQAPSPCHAACPVEGDIAEWIGRIRARDLRGAFDVLTRHNPFPAIAGRVCHHPCEAPCNRAAYDDPLAICRLERHVGDEALAHGWHFAPVEARSERVAVVGGGPSGLSAAFHLRRLGFSVTVFEAASQVGGVMRYGIPAYRLPRSVLDGEIARIVELGVDMRCDSPLTSPGELRALGQEYDAVYVATGAQRQKRLPALDYDAPWVLDGTDYLARSNTKVSPSLGPRVIVIGGGSAAFDVARSARRAGHAVTILALESLEQLPAQREEIEEAREEDITIVAGAMLEAATRHAGGISLACIRVSFEPGLQGRAFSVVRREGTQFTLHGDAIVTAIGQDPDLAPFETVLDANGALLHVDAQQATSCAGIYAGGDLTASTRFVTAAIGAGKRAAWAIGAMLRGGEIGPLAHAKSADVVAFQKINTFYFQRESRQGERRAAVAQRLASACEVQLGLSASQAKAEAQRCFSCGTCIECDNCVAYCPDLAVRHEQAGYTVLADYCKGCGLCAKECPTGSIMMMDEAR